MPSGFSPPQRGAAGGATRTRTAVMVADQPPASRDGGAVLMTDELLKPMEVCAMLNVSRAWLYKAVAAERIPYLRLGGDGPLRFVREDIEQWVEAERAAWRPGRRHQASA